MADRKQQPNQGRQGGQGGQGAQSGRAGQGRPGGGAESRARRQQDELPPPPTGPRETPRLRKRYDEEVRESLVREFNYQNVMQAPKVEKVIINIGMGSQRDAMDNAVRDLETITGQKAVVTRAKRSIANFKLRENEPIGTMVTLRGARMYDFLDKLFNIALPRVRDFSGVSSEAFDGRGNYSLGLREQLIFPEISYDQVDHVRGMQVAIVTTARTDDEGRRLLQLMGMPFRAPGTRARNEEIQTGGRRRRG